MPSSSFYFRDWLVYETSLAQGIFPRPDMTRYYFALCNSLTTDRSGFRWDENSRPMDIVATELIEGNGYARTLLRPGDYRAISAVDTTTGATAGTITATGHNYSNGDPVIFFSSTGAALWLPLYYGQICFVRDTDPVGGRFRVAATPGGPFIPLVGSLSNHFVASAGIWNSTLKRYESTKDSATIRAGVAASGLNYTDLILIADSSIWANREIVGIDTATGTFTTAQNHGLTTSDFVFLTTDAGGTLPTGSQSFENNRVFRVLSPANNTLRLSLDGSTAISITNAGTGTRWLRSATGRIVGAYREDTNPATLPVNIPPGQMRQLVWDWKVGQG